MNEFLKLFLWVAVIGAIFGFLWWQGYLKRLTVYVQDTREELRKCSWPSVDELKGSTIVVMVTIALLSVFLISVDFIISQVMRMIT